MLGFTMGVAIVVALAYLVLFSKSKTVGKYLYQLNNVVESKIAGLSKHLVEIEDEPYVYLRNKQTDKPMLVLLHGFSADKNIWLKFAKYAAKDYFVVIPDFMGHGDIPYQSNKRYSTDDQTKYVTQLILYLAKKHSKQSISLVGNSMGAMVAAQLLQNWEKSALSSISLAQVVLLNPAGAYSEFAIQAHTQQHNPFLHLTENSVFAFYDQAMHKPPFMPPSVFHYIAQAQYLDKYKQHQHMFGDFFDVERFFKDKIQYSTQAPLLVWGDKDGLLPVEDAKVWERILSVKAHIIEQIGHMPMVECPKMTYSLLQHKS